MTFFTIPCLSDPSVCTNDPFDMVLCLPCTAWCCRTVSHLPGSDAQYPIWRQELMLALHGTTCDLVKAP